MLKLFGIDVNKTVVEIVLGLVLVAVIVGGYFIWKHNVTKAAQTTFNNTQLEQVLKDKDKYIETIKEITSAQEAELKALNEQNDALAQRVGAVDKYLASEEVKKLDHPSSEILKHTIKSLMAGAKK